MKNFALLFIFNLGLVLDSTGQNVFVRYSKIGINTPIPVQFENSSGLSGSWIGFYRESEGDGNYISYQYINEQINGEISFAGWKQPGIYNFRLFRDNGYAKIATSNSFLVVQGMIIDSSFGLRGSFHWDVSGAGLGNEVQTVRRTSDGKLFLAGDVANGKFSTNGAPTVDLFVIKLDKNGQLDQNFGQNGKVIISPKSSYYQLYPTYLKAMALQNDGKIVLAGDVIITYPDNTLGYEAYLVRLNQNGTLDNSFGEKGVVVYSFRHDGEDKANFSDEVKCVEITPDQKILVGGGGVSSAPFAPGRPALRSFLINGMPDSSFGAVGLITPTDSIYWRGYIESIIPPQNTGDGTFYAAATARAQFGLNHQLLYKFNPNGSYSLNFGNGKPVSERRPGVHNETFTNKLLYAPDGNLIVYGGSGGYFTWLVKRSSSTGENIPGFGNQGLIINDHPEVESPGGMFMDPDKINIAYTGEFRQLSMTRFNQKGEIDVVFGSPYYEFVDQSGSFIDYHVNDIIRQTENRYVMVGYAHHYNPNHFESFAYAFKDNPAVFTSTEDQNDQNPGVLMQNYPNPFHENTLIPLYLNQNSEVLVEIYNLQGAKLSELPIIHLNQGYHEIRIDDQSILTNLPVGNYLFSILIMNELGHYKTARMFTKQ